ncbi:hypothetical protein [Chitinophaga sp. MM2321]|uniref:hypothetical protein n=1 Tax=Chitinophaga sp. MM2321 TaxID=3137178 RepID=UPI0032D56C77
MKTFAKAINNGFFLQILLSFLLIVVFLPFSYSQGKVSIKGKSFSGALSLLPNTKLAEGLPKIRSPYPGQTDPLADPDKWHGKEGAMARGMLGDAVLCFEWWTTGETPLERYKFDWTSSGYFEVLYANDNGLNTLKRINRNDLKKYPNLLQRFDNITPLSVDFEFNFNTGDKPEQEYYDFRKRYNIMEDLGSAGYAIDYTRTLSGTSILYKFSRDKQDWTSPSIVYSWYDFINIPENLSDKKSRFVELFKMGRSLSITSFKIARIEWKVDEMIEIAQKYTNYENGKEKPSVFDQVKEGKNETKSGGGFWDETDMVDADTESFYDSNTRLYGIKTSKGRVLKTPAFDHIVKSTKQKYYLARKGNEIFLLNNMGAQLYAKILPSEPSIGACPNGQLTAEFTTEKISLDEHDYNFTAGESLEFESGSYKHTSKWYFGSSIPRYSLVVSNGNDQRSSAQIEADDRRREERLAREAKELRGLIAQEESNFKSKGYKPRKEVYCK